METSFMMRDIVSTRRLAIVALAIGAALHAAGRVEAQGWQDGGWYGPYLGGPGPGSTVHGDHARGMGYLSWGVGQYNLATAQANVIDADRMMRYSDYLALSRQIRDYNHAVRIARARARGNQTIAANTRRIRENPNASDLANGSALNAVLEQLSDPKIHPSVLRRTKVPLPGETIRALPFRKASAAGAVCLHQLRARDTWPPALQGEAFAAERRNYQEAIATALEKGQRRDVEPATIRAVYDAVAQLRTRAEATFPRTGPSSVQAAVFLKELSGMAHLLQDPEIVEVLAAIETYAGATVADLVAFMGAHDLRFGPATSAGQRMVYRDLYSRLIQQRDAVTTPIVGSLLPNQDAPSQEGAQVPTQRPWASGLAARR